jgi:hypothetical protein
MRRMKKFTILAAAVLPLLASAAASAAVVSFSDTVFNPSDYTEAVFQNGTATLTPGQTATNGNPGAAHEVTFTIPSGSSYYGTVLSLNNAWVFDPAVYRQALAITYSEDAFLSMTGASVTSRVTDVVVFQNGNYFVHSDATPAVNGNYQTGGAINLLAGTFSLLADRANGTLNSAVHPDFSQLFTLGVQSSIALAGSHGVVDATVRIDNLSVQVLSAPPQVPLPAGVWLLGSALAGLGALRRRLSR